MQYPNQAAIFWLMNPNDGSTNLQILIKYYGEINNLTPLITILLKKDSQ